MDLENLSEKQNLRENYDPVMDVIYSSAGGAKEKYDSVGFFYDKILQIFRIKPMLDAFYLSELKKDEKTLVLGFGSGFLLEKIITATDPIHKVYGLDFSERMHILANRRLSKLNIQNKTKLKIGNVLDMPYKSDSFDVVFAVYVLDIMKINDISRLLYQIKRVLKSDGRLILVAMTKEGKGLTKIMRKLYEWLYQYWPTTFGYHASSRPIYVDEEIEKADFEIINSKLTYIFTFGFPLKVIVAKKTN